MSVEFWLMVLLYALSMGISVGAIWMKIESIEKRVDQLKGIAERILCAEQKTKTAHYRIDSLSRSRTVDKKARRL